MQVEVQPDQSEARVPNQMWYYQVQNKSNLMRMNCPLPPHQISAAIRAEVQRAWKIRSLQDCWLIVEDIGRNEITLRKLKYRHNRDEHTFSLIVDYSGKFQLDDDTKVSDGNVWKKPTSDGKVGL